MKCSQFHFFIFIYFIHNINALVSNNNSDSKLLPLTYNKTTNSFYLTTYFYNNKTEFSNITLLLNLTSSLSYILYNNELLSSSNHIKCEDDSCMLVDFSAEQCEDNITSFCVDNGNNDIIYIETKFAFTPTNTDFKMVLGAYNNNSSQPINEYGQIGLNAAYTSFIPVYIHLNNFSRNKNIFSFCYSKKNNGGYASFLDDNIMIHNNITYSITDDYNYAIYFHKMQLHSQNENDINLVVVNYEEKSDSLGVLSFNTNKLLLPKDMFNNLFQKVLLYIGTRVRHDEVSIQENINNSISFIIKEDYINYLDRFFPLIKFYLGNYEERLSSNPKIIEYNWYPEDYLEFITDKPEQKKEYEFLIEINTKNEVVFGSSLFNKKEIVLNLNNKIFSFCDSECNIITKNNKLLPNIPCDLSEMKFYIKMLQICMTSLGSIVLILIIALLSIIFGKSCLCCRKSYNKSDIEMGFLMD